VQGAELRVLDLRNGAERTVLGAGRDIPLVVDGRDRGLRLAPSEGAR
jgi:hypothetical protein